ncbi:TrbC/VirB2 family protein [Methylicorpusculum sp.]|uniref:TrbC/VirB2 family protein n=1 Tax=Methylicorpusculum sp. TaxID=2713644 RepID=UPI002ABB90A8|nr:TrbC/VirB2 family protein [Methylicorpusculum sp.]MDZ4153604.1 TrbC/VirB2 family protein [Methylicorpusculum sp.]
MSKNKVVSNKREVLMVTMAVAVTFGLMSTGAYADEMGDGVCKLVNLLTGKWLFGFAILATLGAGAALLFGAEMTDGLKKVATIISVVGMILAMSSILKLAFTAFGGLSC